MVRRYGLVGTLAVLLVLAAAPMGPAGQIGAQVAAPAADPGTPPAGVSISQLFDVALGAHQRPAYEVGVTFERSTWAPGASGQASGSGSVRIDYVLAGSVSIDLVGGTLLVQRAAPDGMPGAMEPVPEMTEVELNPGDVAVYPADADFLFWLGQNKREGNAIVLSLMVESLAASHGAGVTVDGNEGVAFEAIGIIGADDWAQVPAGPLAISLRRTTLPPGVGLPLYPVLPAVPELLVVESGVMEVRDYLADGTDLGSVTVSRGGLVPPPYWDQASRAIRAGTEPPPGAGGEQPSAPEPLVFLSLTFAAAPPGSAPTPVPIEAVAPRTDGYAPGSIVVVGGDEVNLRETPGPSGAIIQTLRMGEELTVIDGPIAADDFTWYRVETADGTVGYVVADLIEGAE